MATLGGIFSERLFGDHQHQLGKIPKWAVLPRFRTMLAAKPDMRVKPQTRPRVEVKIDFSEKISPVNGYGNLFNFNRLL